MPEAARDWTAFFAEQLGSSVVPALAAREYVRNQATIRDRYLDARAELDEIRRKVPALAVVFLYADVLRIPKGYRLTVDGFALVVFARLIEFEDAAAGIDVDWSKTGASSLNVFAQELALPAGVTSWPIRTITREATSPIPPQPVTPRGLSITWSTTPAPAPAIRSGAGIPAALSAEDSHLALSLGSIFQTATLLFHRPEGAGVAQSQLAWVQACAAQSADQTALMLQSAGLLSMLQVRAAGSKFVPQLSRSVYAATARAFTEKARVMEQQHERFTDQRETIEARIAAARLIVANADDAMRYTDDLIKQAFGNLTGATSAMETADANLRKQTDLVEQTGVQFQVSLKQWLEQKKVEGAFKILSSIVTFGVAAGKIAYGDATSGPAAADAAAGALSAAGSFGVYAEAARQVAATMDKLRKMLETLGKLYTLIEKIAGASIDLTKAGGVRDELARADLTPKSDVDPSAWDIFRLRADDQLELAVTENIHGGVDYRQQLRILVIYGKALTTARTAVVGAAQELARLRLTRALHEKEKQRAEKFIAELTASQEPKAALQQLMFQRFLDAKRSLFVALEQYRAAYEYWALRPSEVKASIGDRITVFDTGLAELAKVQLDEEAALRGFAPPPHPMNESFLITDANVLDALRKTRTATFSVGLDLPELIGLGRVRVTTLRVWLIGAAPADRTSTIEVVLRNSGDYADRIVAGAAEQQFQFTATPLDTVFRYSLAAGSGPRVEHPDITGWVRMDGKVFDEVSYAYFVPTPFSQWTIRVPETVSPTLDLAKLTGIRMEIAGSAIPNKNIKGQRAAQQ